MFYIFVKGNESFQKHDVKPRAFDNISKLLLNSKQLLVLKITYFHDVSELIKTEFPQTHLTSSFIIMTYLTILS